MSKEKIFSGGNLWFLAVVLALVLIIVFRFEAALSAKDELKKFRNTNQITELEGLVIAEPDKRDANIRLKIKTIPQGEYILITANLFPEYQYGHYLKIKGKLREPKEYEDFNYKNYLLKDKIRSVMYYPEIEILEENRGHPVLTFLFKIKDKLRISVFRSLPSPQSELLSAIILGDKQKLSEELKSNFNKTGIRHITAISGMHITIMTGIIIAGFIALGLSRGKAIFLTLPVLALYILMIGAPASAVRAGLMGFLAFAAESAGRMYLSRWALVLTALVMLVFNPLLLLYDVGFQLSFLAVLGIIELSPVFNFFLKRLRLFKNKGLRTVVSMTLSAQIFTLPILIYNFGQFSLVSPLVNVLIVPILSLVLIFGFLGAFAGLFFQTAGLIASVPVLGVLSYILKTSAFFAQLPFSSIKIENLAWWWLIVLYAVLFLALKKLKNVVK